ncbi:MAG: dephospho-CoA kinase [Deltaproteobacteria bacterium]
MATTGKKRHNPRPYLIAVTGGAGSGKSTACRIMERLGIPVIDADGIVHGLVIPGSQVLALLTARFGPAILQKDGSLNRKALLDLILFDAEARRFVEEAIHPEVRAKIRQSAQKLALSGHDIVAVEVPLLFEKGWEKDFDHVLAVIAPEETCIERIAQRMGISLETARKLVSIQMPQDEKARRADTVLINANGIEQLEQKVADFIQRIRNQVSVD